MEERSEKRLIKRIYVSGVEGKRRRGKPKEMEVKKILSAHGWDILTWDKSELERFGTHTVSKLNQGIGGIQGQAQKDL